MFCGSLRYIMWWSNNGSCCFLGMTGVFENLAQFFKLCDLYHRTGFFKSSTVLLNNGMMPTYTGCRRLWRGTGTQESPTPAIGSWFKSAGISIVQAVSWPANFNDRCWPHVFLGGNACLYSTYMYLSEIFATCPFHSGQTISQSHLTSPSVRVNSFWTTR